MSLTSTDVKRIADLAQLSLSEADLALYVPQLSNILTFVEQMNAIPMDASDSTETTKNLPLKPTLRSDEVTECNQRKTFQAIAPLVAEGYYLVPKVL